jgi:putative tricarboxylic transport membrane protein
MSGPARDLVVAVLILVFCGLTYLETNRIPTSVFSDLGAAFWPRVSLVFMAGLAMILLVQSAVRLQRSRAGGAAAAHAPIDWERYRNPLWCVALFAAFVVAVPWLGMLLGGILLVFAVLTATGQRNPSALLLHLLIALGLVGAMWALFTFGLRVLLPAGRLLPF